MSQNLPNFGVPAVVNRTEDNSALVTKEARMNLVLAFMAEHGLALQPSNVYFNLEQRGATFAKKSCDRYLKEMADEGLIERIEGTDGFYQITEEGIKRAKEIDRR